MGLNFIHKIGVFLFFLAGTCTLFSQEKVVEVTYRHNADNSVNFMYKKNKPGSYTFRMKFNTQTNFFANEYKEVLKYDSGSLMTIKPINQNKSVSFSYTTSYTRGDENAKIDSLFQYCLPFKDGKKVRLVESSNLNEKYFGAEKHESWKSYAVITKSQDSIFAMRKGIVIEIKNEFSTDTLAKGYIYTSKRNSITIEHEDGTYARYSGLKMNSMSVQLGDVVYPSTYLGVLDIFNNKDYVLHFNVYYLAKKDFVYDSKATLRTLKTPYSYLIPYFHTKEGVTKIKNRETYTAHHTPEIITKEMTKKEKKKYFKKNS